MCNECGSDLSPPPSLHLQSSQTQTHTHSQRQAIIHFHTDTGLQTPSLISFTHTHTHTHARKHTHTHKHTNIHTYTCYLFKWEERSLLYDFYVQLTRKSSKSVQGRESYSRVVSLVEIHIKISMFYFYVVYWL